MWAIHETGLVQSGMAHNGDGDTLPEAVDKEQGDMVHGEAAHEDQKDKMEAVVADNMGDGDASHDARRDDEGGFAYDSDGARIACAIHANGPASVGRDRVQLVQIPLDPDSLRSRFRIDRSHCGFWHDNARQ